MSLCARAKRDGRAAERFFRIVLKAEHNQEPRVINVDIYAAYPPAIDSLTQDQTLPENTQLRLVKYLNNIVELFAPIHQAICQPRNGECRSFNTARRTLRGYESMNMIRKGQINGVEKGDVRAQVEFVFQIFGVAA